MLFLSVCATGLIACIDNSNAQSPSQGLQFVELNSGQFTQTGLYTQKQSRVITTQEDYASELATYTSVPPVAVDFSKGKVLLVDMGKRNTGGYTIEVTSVDVGVGYVIANVSLTKPGSGCVVATVLTNPYQFVYIPTLTEILISERLETTNCN